MSEDTTGEKASYEVGYGKPPKRTQFVPGQSGFKGRSKAKKSEAVSRLIARISAEEHEVGGQMMTNIELALRQVYNTTIKSGKPRDLKLLMDLLDKYGSISKVDEGAEAKANGDKAMRKIHSVICRHLEIDPKDVEALARYNDAEAEAVMACPDCGPAARKRWKEPEYVQLNKRYGQTGLHKQVIGARKRDLSKPYPT